MIRVLNKQNYNLLRELVISDFKIRYQGSVLGYFWSLLKPLALFTILYIVFAKFFRFGETVPFFAAYLLLGIVLWTFFTEATNTALKIIVERGDLIRKVTIPKYILVFSATFSALINMILNLLVVGIFLVLSGAPIMLTLLLLPLVVAELYAFTLAVSFLLAALYVKFRDILYIWEVGLQGLFYATPIIYPLSIVPEQFQSLLLYNPIAQIIQDARYLSVTPETTTAWQVLGPKALIPLGVVVAAGFISSWYFKRQSRYFAEDL